MKLSERQRIYTRNIGSLIGYAFATGFELAVGEFQRPIEMQKIYFDTGRSKTMESRHLNKLAGDFTIWFAGRMLFAPGQTNAEYLADLELMRPLGMFWVSLHADNVWGGDWNRNNVMDENFRDPYHFEMKPTGSTA